MLWALCSAGDAKILSCSAVVGHVEVLVVVVVVMVGMMMLAVVELGMQHAELLFEVLLDDLIGQSSLRDLVCRR